MSDLTVEQLRQRIRGIHARNEAIRIELAAGIPEEKGSAYKLLLEMEIPLNDARFVMATAHLDLLLSIQKREAAKPRSRAASEAMS